jgi:phosphoserine phosphatase RsbU/P
MALPDDIPLSPEAILESINDGVYVTDRDRRIVYWSTSAERITGWARADVLGRRCCDDILCHRDEDDRKLCGEEYCPLHRAIITGTRGTYPVTVYASTPGGREVALRVSVAPIRDSAGTIVGGVETFRDFTQEKQDLDRAKRIQSLALGHHVPDGDPRLTFRTHYRPHDMIGGDYFAIERLDPSRYGFLLADVTGHGVAAALYTMHLASLWRDHRAELDCPAQFASCLNDGLCRLVRDEESFAVGLCGTVDAATGEVRLVGAGNPPALRVDPDGRFQQQPCAGMPLGLEPGQNFDEAAVTLSPGQRLLLYTDGASDIRNAEGISLGSDGLFELLSQAGYPGQGFSFEDFDEALLRYTEDLRLPDDLTFLEIHRLGGG